MSIVDARVTKNAASAKLWCQMSASLMKSKIRGLFVGVLSGDCLGWPFEGDEYGSSLKLTTQNYFDRMASNVEGPFKHFTDDYAMTKAVAQALIEKQPADYEHIAKSMVIEFSKKTTRGYEPSTMNVFASLKNSAFKNVFQPAKAISYMGGGGASRVGPIASFYHKDYQTMLEVARKSTEITHCDLLGVNGALLQCIAIHQALLTPPNAPIEVEEFLEGLKQKIGVVEGVDTGVGMADRPYGKKLELVSTLLAHPYEDQHMQDEKVVKILGNSSSAFEAVPTGIYCFLRAQTGIERVNAENTSLAAIQYAISLGGATDLIASLAGAIGGAYFGYSAFDEKIKKHLEMSESAVALADQLYEEHLKQYPE